MNAELKQSGTLIRSYIDISKPRLVLLLYFTAFSSIIIASSIYGYDWLKITLISIAVIFGVIGSNASTAFIDREMDGMMSRTNHRPVPSGKIYPARNALIYGLIMVFIGVVIAAFINYLSSLFLFLGFLDSAIIYNMISKKKSSLNVIFGAPAGGMPVLVGWTAVANKIDVLAILMFVLVIIWTPMHIWSLAYFYKEDYRKAGIPMLPVIWSERKMFTLLTVLGFLLVLFSIIIGILAELSLLYIIVTSVFGSIIIILSLLLIIKNSKKYAWLLFKFSSPYLAVIFLLMIIDYVFI